MAQVVGQDSKIKNVGLLLGPTVILYRSPLVLLKKSMSLCPLQDELIRVVAGAAPKLFLVNQTGSSIDNPWVEDIDASLQCWYAGQEVGNALADPISGDSSPSSKLPVTFSRCIEDSFSFGNFPTDHGTRIRHEEGLEMGYRAHNKPASVLSI
ncbi:hypothetical protein N7513_000453 [Penicillium frequentans]|nr:hypothetical protein N7513_000453 [Penicillium glabrum]